MQLNFVNKDALQLSDKAFFRIRIKEPYLLRTKHDMSPITREQVFHGQSYLEGPVPGQI